MTRIADSNRAAESSAPLTIALDLRPLSIPEKAGRGIGRIVNPLLAAAARRPDLGRFLLLVAPGQRPASSASHFEIIETPWGYGDISGPGWLSESRRTGSLLNSLRPDLYHAPDLYIPRGFDGPMVVTVCDYFDLPLLGPVRLFGHAYGWRWNFAFRWRYRLTWRAIVHAAAGVAAISETTAGRVRRRFPALADRLVAIPLGLEDDWFEPAPEDGGLLDRHGLSRPLIIHVGGLERRKNPEGVLGVFARFRREHPTATLGLIGPLHGPKEEGPGIRLLGYVARDELRRLYAAADALLFPSFDEGFGLPVIEALASGCPVVTSRGTATEEVARGHATLVDPDRPDEILDGLRRVVAAPRPPPATDLNRSAMTAQRYFALYAACARRGGNLAGVR